MPTINNYLQILTQAGLKGDQALVYEALLKSGPKKASSLGNFVPFKRSLTYKILSDLVEMGLVVKKEEKGKVAVFEAAHPFKIKEWVEKRQEQFKNAEIALSGFLPKLVSDFNMVLGMPGIQIFEGTEGAKKVVADSLQSQSEVLSYTDFEIVDKYYSQFNKQYVEQRRKKNIKKKMIAIDSLYNRQNAGKINDLNTQVRLISNKSAFSALMYIYDNKISYITLRPDRMISFIVEHEALYQMHKNLFFSHWQTAKETS